VPFWMSNTEDNGPRNPNTCRWVTHDGLPFLLRRTSVSADDNHKSSFEGVDRVVRGELETPAMSELQILRSELERMEASIAEVRKQELGVDDRLAEIQKEKDDLVATRAALEKAAALMRECLGRPASSIVVQLSTSRPVRPQAIAMVPRKNTRPGSKRDQHLAVLKPLFENESRSASRQEIKQAWLDAGLLEGSENIESAVSGMLTHFKNYGHITTDNRGTWTWIGLR
jgi:hypothetical protein